VLIVDTAGRLGIDEMMMAEVKAIHAAVNPIETLFVVDSMQGQDAVNVAKAFNEALPITGIVLTKLDGDARGGAALSVRHVTGKPIKFVGVSEKMDGLEAFHPERMASRILGMGDIISLVEEAHARVDAKEAQKLAEKFKKGKDFDLEDFKSQLQQMKNMGGIASMADKLPLQLTQMAQSSPELQEKALKRTEAIINSMTPQERRLANVVLEHQRDFASYSATELARRADVLIGNREAVHAMLAPQLAIGKRPANFQRNALDASFIAQRLFYSFHLVIHGLCPPHVHALQHLGPILGISAAGTGVDVQDSVVVVVAPGKHQRFRVVKQQRRVYEDAGTFFVVLL